MKFPLYIALRYLFSPKKHSAINIISLICAVGVCIGTLALVCILSVYNGFQDLIGGTFSQLDPDIRITLAEGKVFDGQQTRVAQVRNLPQVVQSALVFEENAVVKCGERQTWLTVKGVADDYRRMVATEHLMRDGRFVLNNGQNEFGVLGLTLAIKLDAGIYAPKQLELYAPRHDASIQLGNPEAAFNQASLYLAGIYSVEQEEVDGKYMFVSLPQAQRLFGYEATSCTGLELRLAKDARPESVKEAVKQLLGSEFKVEDKKEQHQEFYRMLKIEKWISFLILAFILLIAVLNVTGSLSMLIIEKKNDIATLRNLGADSRTIGNIFLLEGWFVTAIGAAVGVVAGLALCLAQQLFGFIKLGTPEETGMFLTDAYPVEVQMADIAIVLVTVWLLGLLVAWIPTRMLRS